VPANPGAHRQYELVAVANRSTRVPQSAVYRGVGAVATACAECARLEVAKWPGAGACSPPLAVRLI